MGEDSAIVVEELSKSYLIGHERGTGRYNTLRESIARGVVNLAQKTVDAFRGRQILHGEETEEFWALRDVSFTVNRGEVLGIIGRNGAGKSTLLKVLSRITEPTGGRVTIRGRVASLLEVGTGFHPELTGRENIFLNGAVLGMTRAEIRRKFDEIVAFAEVEKFLDTPVKHYSSGMYVRLAFAVAAHLEPEILVVDEVLAVGDTEFQKKCLGKMKDVASGGRTVLLVSHNMVAVQSLCERCITLSAGSLISDGTVEEAILRYVKTNQVHGLDRSWDLGNQPGNEKVLLRRIAIIPENDFNQPVITMQTSFNIEIDYDVGKNDLVLHVMFHLLNSYGVCVLTSSPKSIVHNEGTYRSVCRFPGNLLNQGGYSIKIQVVERGSTIIYAHDDALSFNVIDNAIRTGGWMGREPGVVQPKFPWTTRQVELRDSAMR